MSRFEKLYEAMEISTMADKADVLSEIFKTGGEELFNELYRLYVVEE